MMRAKWEDTQFKHDRAGIKTLPLYRRINLDTPVLAEAEKTGKWVQAANNRWRQLPALNVVRNEAASTTTDESVANGWGSGVDRVVLRAQVPRTAAVSVPAYGINVLSEHEVVVAGTAWKGWDAWREKAPTFDSVPLAA